jgi:L-fuconolactonase
MSASRPPFRGAMHRALPELAAWIAQYEEPALEPELAIVDPHHHLWDDERGRYLLDEFTHEVSASGHNVVATVYAQFKAMYRAGVAEAFQPVGEVEFANGLAAVCASGRYGSIRVAEGIIAHADLLLGDDVRPVLEALVAAGNGRLKGIRHGTQWDDGEVAHGRVFTRHLLLDPKFRRGFAQLAPLGLSFDAWMYYHQLDDLKDLLGDFPGTTVVLDHVGGAIGLPPHTQRDEVFATWRRHLRELARFPNLNVKLGGLGMPYTGWYYHLDEMPPASARLAADWRPYLETCIETFGVQRCMFESNFPMDKQSCSLAVLWNAFKRITAGCSATDKAALYHDTAVRVYRLPRSPIGRVAHSAQRLPTKPDTLPRIPTPQR